MSFEEAKLYCKSHQGHIVSVESQTETEFLEDHFHYVSGSEPFHIGATRNFTDGLWYWQASGQEVKFVCK